LPFIENHLPINGWVYAYSLPVLHCLDECSFIVSFEIEKYSFFRLFLAVGYLRFHENFRMFVNFCKKKKKKIAAGKKSQLVFW
jgi:hypothetical protein